MRIPFVRRRQNEKDASCHAGPQADTSGLPVVAIVGCPSVGKSVLFHALTGAYVTVSNFPGTTVEVSRGKGRIDGTQVGYGQFAVDREIEADVYVRLNRGGGAPKMETE